MNKNPHMIVVTTKDRFYYIVEWNHMESFKNPESGDYDVIPTVFDGFHYNTTTQTVGETTHSVLGCDVDRIVAIM